MINKDGKMNANHNMHRHDRLAGTTLVRSDNLDARPVTSSDLRPLLVTTAEAARMLGIARSSVYQLIAQGVLSPIHIGRSVRFAVRDLEMFVERLVAEAS